ncbi:MAG: 4Fe-4S binding protein, partial [Anaerovoracaceae bacterium]|nr:4Fe-4S binding protein [Anaerovoracaceae bacterium]
MIEKRETIPNGFVMDIQPFSVNDGNGIRTTIFLAGCPLRCQWCSNPEGFSQRELVGWHQRKCIGCGKCAEVCPEGIGIGLSEERFADRINRISENDRCTACGACVKVCP